MESAMSACSGAMAMARCLTIDSRGINTNYGAAVGLPRLSLSSNRYLVFSDQSRVQYYGGMVKPYCGKINKLKDLCALSDGSLSEKKRVLKLLQSSFKDLSVLSMNPTDANASLTEQVRGQIVSDVVSVLIRQLEQAIEESKKRKQQLRAQKKALKFAQKRKKNKGLFQDLSSSSSSSDNESRVVDMTLLLSTQQVGRNLEDTERSPLAFVESPPNVAEVKRDEKALHVEFAEASDRLGLNSGVGIPVQEVDSVIKVCMGGKCKKSGSEMLLGAFKERINKSGKGCEVKAVGCKCMGKCRNGPNVGVHSTHEEGFHGGKGVVHMGVDIADVDLILAHLFG